MKIFITMLMVLMAVPVFAKQDIDTKDLTPPTIKNWYVYTYHTKDYDEMTDEVFEEVSMTSVLQSFKVEYVSGEFAIGHRVWKDADGVGDAEGILLSLDEVFQPNEDSVLVRFDKRPAERFNTTTINHKDENGLITATSLKIGNDETEFAKFIDLCKKSSKLLIRVEAGERSKTVTIDLTNFTKVYDIYAKNRPTKK